MGEGTGEPNVEEAREVKDLGGKEDMDVDERMVDMGMGEVRIKKKTQFYKFFF